MHTAGKGPWAEEACCRSIPHISAAAGGTMVPNAGITCFEGNGSAACPSGPGSQCCLKAPPHWRQTIPLRPIIILVLVLCDGTP